MFNLIFELYPEEIYLAKITKNYVYNGKTLGLLKNYLAPSYNYKKYYGYDPIQTSYEQKEIFKKVIEKEIFYGQKVASKEIKINPITDKLISYIKNKCDYNNSKLIFVTSPTLNEISDEQRSKTKLYFKAKGIMYLDYSSFLDDSNLDNWKDFTHLSNLGANLFSKELMKVFKGGKFTYN